LKYYGNAEFYRRKLAGLFGNSSDNSTLIIKNPSSISKDILISFLYKLGENLI